MQRGGAGLGWVLRVLSWECMKDLQIGTLLPIFLFFILFVGIIIIYREEIEKMELFGRLHTTPVPEAKVRESTVPPPSELGTPSVPSLPPVVHSAFVDNRGVSFEGGRVVNSGVQDVAEEVLVGGKVLYTVASGVSDYQARAFVEEAAHLYSPSPYSGSVVFLDRVSGIRESNPDREHFIILVSNNVINPVIVTDWKIFDRQVKRSYRFPAGVKVLGSNEVSSPVAVQAGDTVVVSSGGSPVGVSFLVNKCSGYRSQFKKFVPTIKTACPEPIREFSQDGTVPISDVICYETVSNLPICTAAAPLPSGTSKECRVFLKEVLNEKGCVKRHRNDADFLSSEWRLFLDSEVGLWKNRDNVLYLLDENDLLVATLIYR